MILDQKIIDMYEKTRTTQLITELQQQSAVLTPFATVISGCNGDMHQLPAIGSCELDYRTERMEEIVADELSYARRNMRPILFQKFLKWSTDDALFLNNLPANADAFVRELSKAAERVKDSVLLGTVVDRDEASPTVGQYVIKTPTTLYADAIDGSPYKGGATGGLLGANYVGKLGDSKEELPVQPYIYGDGLLETWDQFTADTYVDAKRTNVIPHNYVASGTPASSGLTVDKLLYVLECFQTRYALNGTLNMAITPKQATELMRDEKFQNGEYGRQVLKTGFESSFLNIRFLITQSVPLVNVGTASAPKFVRACPVWRTEDLIYGVWDNAKFHMRQPDTYIDKMLVGVTYGMGAARTREETVISVHCDEGFAA